MARNRGPGVETVWDGAPDNQEVQICLRRDASDQEDNKIRGTVWIDDVTLTPIPGSRAPKSHEIFAHRNLRVGGVRRAGSRRRGRLGLAFFETGTGAAVFWDGRR